MKNAIQILLCCLVFVQTACAQTLVSNRPHCSNIVFDERVADQISFTVPLIGTEELAENPDAYHVFDTRKYEEYTTSHIPGANYLGYRDFDVKRLKDLPYDSPIVLYCSIGYRSEKIGEKLQELGYTHVYNLYGSIFDWVNRGYLVVGENENPTEQVHTYNRAWSKWVEEGAAVKVW